MFLYCFIFIHIIYVTKEMIFFLFSKHYLFCIAAILLCLIKALWSYLQVPSLSPSLGTTLSPIRTCCQERLAATHLHLRVKKRGQAL